MNAVIDGGEATWASVMRAAAADPSIPLLTGVFVLAVFLLRSRRFGEPRNLSVACEGKDVSITDEFEAGEQPTCPTCGTVMREVDGGYECAWDGTVIDVPWVERPAGGDNLPGLRGA